MKFINRYRAQIESLCVLHKVRSLYAFGSVLNDNFNSESDIDLVVDFSDVPLEDYADNYFDLKFNLQHIFNRKIDLLESQAIRNPFLKKNIEKHKKLIYG